MAEANAACTTRLSNMPLLGRLYMVHVVILDLRAPRVVDPRHRGTAGPARSELDETRLGLR
jgi:hypothetical protein